ncbi:unnamed protein product [Moneuplotes crassus]|uniref:Uncharacterized protein n=1 Tax=Euplotes crassus TaxID=5936 RepID=A0AAD2D5G4_EUPCR|nr:unnamed protein product [Moneuplotes crassus]
MAKGALFKVSKNWIRYITDKVKSYDMYPRSINFTMGGEEEFKTLIGGGFSLIIKVVILFYAYLMLRLMYERKNNQKSVNNVVTDILNDPDPTYINNSDFSFAFKVFVTGDDSFDVLSNPYVTAEFMQYTRDPTTKSLSSSTISLSTCGSTLFHYYNQTEAEQIQIDEFVCPESRDITLQGGSFSDSYQYAQLKLKKCQSGCPPDLDTVLGKMRVEIPFVNSYFDFQDFESPSKTFIDGRLTSYILPGYSQKSNVYLQSNEAEHVDSFLAYQPGGEEKEFIEVNRVDKTTSVQYDSLDYTVFQMVFLKDPTSKSYERVVFTFLEAFGNIGGLLEVLTIAGGFIVGLFSEKIFLFTILSKLYQVEKPKTDKDFRGSDVRVQSLSMNDDPNFKNKSIASKLMNKEMMVQEAQKRMRKKARYQWKFTDFFYDFISWVPFCICFCCRKNEGLNIKRRNKLFSKGADKFINEFDAVHFAKSMREVKTLLASIMDEDERFMIPFQKCNSIPMNTDSEESSEEDAYKEVPKLFARSNETMLHISRVDDFMEQYLKRNWYEKDYRLINGVISTTTLKDSQIPSNRPSENYILPETLPTTIQKHSAKVLPTHLSEEDSKAQSSKYIMEETLQPYFDSNKEL